MAPLPAWLHGLFAVLPTPMVAGGSLDLESLDRVVDHYLDGGAVGLVPASIAGEGDLLDEAERRLVIQRVARRSGGRAPVVVSVLADDTVSALAQARIAVECGASGLLVKPPTGDARGVLGHVDAIARSLRLPIILLDNPKFSASLPASLVQTLVDTVSEVCGIKLEEEPTADKMAQVRALLGQRIRIFGGLGGVHCLRELAQGADGFFTGHPQPAHLVAAMACFRRGDRDGAATAYEALLPVASWEREHPDAMISQRKTILRELGVLLDAAVRPPGKAPRSAVDQTALNRIRSLQPEGQPDVLVQVIRAYLKNSRAMVNALHDALARGDVGKVREVAHRLRSSTATLGAMTLADMCAELETRGQLAGVVDLSRRLEVEYRAVCTTLGDIARGR